MKLLVKYCGGCNVYYDRPQVVAEIERRFPGLEITYSGTEADYVAVLCGCASQCLPHDDLKGRVGKLLLSGPDQVPRLMEALGAMMADA